VFLVSDSLENRAEVVRYFLKKHPPVALVVAAAYFEWTVSRALVALSDRPNRDVREALAGAYGLDRYKDLWRSEQRNLPGAQTLPKLVKDWNGVTNAFVERNRLVHGRDRHTRNMARPHVEVLLSAVADIYQYAEVHGVNLRERLPIRKKIRTARNVK
jgi:hypothetical protein